MGDSRTGLAEVEKPVAAPGRTAVFKSSLRRSYPAIFVAGTVGGALIVRSITAFIRYGTDIMGWIICGERALFGSMLLGLVCYVWFHYGGRRVQVAPLHVTCTHRGRTLEIPLLLLVVGWPRQDRKTDRILFLSDGEQLFRVEERFFPEFNALLTRLQALQRAKAREERRLE